LQREIGSRRYRRKRRNFSKQICENLQLATRALAQIKNEEEQKNLLNLRYLREKKEK